MRTIYIIVILIIIIVLSQKTVIEEYLDVKINKEIVNIGSEHFKNSNLILCGLARDIEKNIRNLDKQINTITSCFNKHLIIIVENDSKDNTVNKLLELKEKYNIILLHPNLSKNIKERTKGSDFKRMQKMADLRNVYMDYINKIENNDYQYCIMLDCDLDTIIESNKVKSSGYYFQNYSNIDMIGCNTLRKCFPNNIYYDLYSLGNSLKKIWFLNKFNYNNNNLIKVDSCFGGFVIYKLSSIIGKKYICKKTWYGAECEHVTFNKKLNVYLNPKMLLPIFAHD